MDPNTVVIILAVNLIAAGGLFHLIGRNMPVRSGVLQWAAGSLLFGVAYLARLVGGRSMGLAGDVLADTAMVFGALLLLAGLRRWLGKAPLRRRWLLWLAVGYVLVQLGMVAAWDQPGRFMLLNLTLAVVYGLIAWEGAVARNRQPPALNPPLWMLTVLMGGLGLLTALRGLSILTLGLSALYEGPYAQVYYAYATLAVALMSPNLLWMLFVRLNGQLQELASRDALTRVLNRNGLEDVLVRHFAARDAQPVTLLEVDVDHFKRINDEHGHAVGDKVLRAVADALAKRVRGNDFVARVGGEEFLVGCIDGDGELALALGQRLRSGVAELLLPGREGRPPVTCTVSVGVSGSFGTLADRDRALQEADQALYAAKAGGRNRVVVFGDAPASDEPAAHGHEAGRRPPSGQAVAPTG